MRSTSRFRHGRECWTSSEEFPCRSRILAGRIQVKTVQPSHLNFRSQRSQTARAEEPSVLHKYGGYGSESSGTGASSSQMVNSPVSADSEFHHERGGRNAHDEGEDHGDILWTLCRWDLPPSPPLEIVRSIPPTQFTSIETCVEYLVCSVSLLDLPPSSHNRP